MRILTTCVLATLSLPVFMAVPVRGEELPGVEALLKQKEGELANLARENALLKERVHQFECTPSITSEALSLKKYKRLQDISRDVKAQRQTMTEFEGFVKWMTTNLSGYSRYVEAGSVAAGFAKVLPIPYAGQASLFTKFVSQGLLSLNAASVAIAKYLGTSQQFITRVDAMNSPEKMNTAEVAALSRFADEQLFRDMGDVQLKLKAISELSSSSLSFLESLNHYIGGTDEYWNKTKSILKRGDVDKKEKSFLSESTQNLKNGASAFNTKLTLFEETTKKNGPLIKSLGAYDELLREMEAKASQMNADVKVDSRGLVNTGGKP